MPTSVALGEYFENFVKRQLASGRFNNVSEVIRTGLRLMEDAEQENAARLKALRTEIKAGLDSGAGREADKVFDRLEAKYRRMAAKA